MRKLFITSLLLVLLLPALPKKSSALTIPNWQSLYYNHIQQMANSSEYDWHDSYMSLVDFDLDGVPELVVGLSYRTVEEIYGIYTISNNQVVELEIYLDGKKQSKKYNSYYNIEMSTFFDKESRSYGGLKLYKHKTTGDELYYGEGTSGGAASSYINFYKMKMVGKQMHISSIANFIQDHDHEAEFFPVNYYVKGKKVTESVFNQTINAATADYVEVDLDVFTLESPVTYDYDYDRYILKQSLYSFTFPAALNARLSPSNWAFASVESAIELGLVPADLDRGYHNAITREDFSRLAIQYLTVHYQVTKDQLSSKLNITKSDSAPFTDTTSQDVSLAYNLGVVAGKGEKLFEPNGVITRQEAAVMLGRLAKLTDKKSTNSTISFSDTNKIASWAQESVKYVTGIKDTNSGSQVMGSAGNNQFNPQGTFTTEQAFITFKRLLDS